MAEKIPTVTDEVSQTTAWQNWEPTDIGPQATRDAPVLLRMGPKDYWFFAKFGRPKSGKNGNEKFTASDAQLEGFDIPLKTTPYPNQYDAPGGLKKSAGGHRKTTISASAGVWFTAANAVRLIKLTARLWPRVLNLYGMSKEVARAVLGDNEFDHHWSQSLRAYRVTDIC